MSFRTSGVLLLTHTPSLQFNNLSHDGHDRMCFAYQTNVDIVNKDTVATTLPFPRAEIHQVAFIKISGLTYLVVLSDVWIQLWSADCRDMLFSHSVEDQGSHHNHFFRGVAGGGSAAFFSVGSSKGNIMIFNVLETKENHIIFQSALSTGSKAAITSMTASENYLIVGNDVGDIIGFNPKETFASSFHFKGKFSPCTSLALHNDVLISTFTTGSIRIYRLNILELAIEIAAHADCINGLALSTHLNVFATCSDDSFVHVWSLPSFDSKAASVVELLSSSKLENKACTGIVFSSKNSIAVSSYDSFELINLRRS